MEEVYIAGKNYSIETVLCGNRCASARFKEGRVLIKLPARWPESERLKAKVELFGKIAKRIRRHPEFFEKRELFFSDGQEFSILGRNFRLLLKEGRGRSSKAVVGGDGVIEVVLANGLSDDLRSRHVYKLASKAVADSFLPFVKARVDFLNHNYFNFYLGGVFLKDMNSRWGSCAGNRINLSFRLLFVPPEVMDYVIIHELAHLSEKNHGKGFWTLVEKAMPDYRNKRKLLGGLNTFPFSKPV